MRRDGRPGPWRGVSSLRSTTARVAKRLHEANPLVARPAPLLKQMQPLSEAKATPNLGEGDRSFGYAERWRDPQGRPSSGRSAKPRGGAGTRRVGARAERQCPPCITSLPTSSSRYSELVYAEDSSRLEATPNGRDPSPGERAIGSGQRTPPSGSSSCSPRRRSLPGPRRPPPPSVRTRRR